MSQDKEITQFKRLHANVPIFDGNDDPNAGSAVVTLEMDRREIDTPVEHANIEALRAEIMKIDNMLTKNGVHPGRDVKDRDGDTIMDLSAMSRDKNKFKDTGACGNFISKDFILMNRLEGDLEKAVPITVRAATGKTVMVDEVLLGNVRFAIADVELSDSMIFYVVDGLVHDGLLGNGFCRQNRELMVRDKQFQPQQVMSVTIEQDIDESQHLENVQKQERLHDGYSQKLLKDYTDTVTEESPETLPPTRDITHRIVVYPGALPTSRPQYRMGPSK
ncbi:hypothetical protein CANARDRAFT_7631 [[Candida] arabinofermentans NRRL YB-2248]|uniref:Uncharacterized protein n=1 Tax=[Candida] arabinofermentans NRRL YB-2248 TaxID=983967 RepID=A0A1E4T1A3_9ASCO|nr:hypothetical protein CANARDRAFT_7631 [[Candida] arabinofermentans NRRL YB-2248]